MDFELTHHLNPVYAERTYDVKAGCVVVWLWWVMVIMEKEQGWEVQVRWRVGAGMYEPTGADAERKRWITSECVEETPDISLYYLSLIDKKYIFFNSGGIFLPSFDSFISSGFEPVDELSGRDVKSFKRTVHLLRTC